MKKYTFLIALTLLTSGCASVREHPYVMAQTEQTTRLTIEDTYAPKFAGIPIFTKYFDRIKIYDSNVDCPYLTQVSYNDAERPGYLGTFDLNKNQPKRTINLESSRAKYIDIYREKNIANSAEWCASSYRLDIKNDTSYYIKFDGNACRAAFYEVDSKTDELKRIDSIAGESKDERLCL